MLRVGLQLRPKAISVCIPARECLQGSANRQKPPANIFRKKTLFKGSEGSLSGRVGVRPLRMESLCSVKTKSRRYQPNFAWTLQFSGRNWNFGIDFGQHMREKLSNYQLSRANVGLQAARFHAVYTSLNEINDSVMSSKRADLLGAPTHP